jgi:hypothetical protein
LSNQRIWGKGNWSVDWLANFSILRDWMNFYILETHPEKGYCLITYPKLACLKHSYRFIVFFFWVRFAPLLSKKNKINITNYLGLMILTWATIPSCKPFYFSFYRRTINKNATTWCIATLLCTSISLMSPALNRDNFFC